MDIHSCMSWLHRFLLTLSSIKIILFLVLVVSEEGLKVWLSTAKRLRKQKAARLWYAFIISLVGQGTPAFSCLGFPMQGMAKQKNKKSLLWTPFQHSGHHPSPFFPTPKTTHLHLHLQACMSACQHRGGYRSHHSSGYLSKKNVLKETPRAQWCNPTPCHGAWPHWAAHRLWKEVIFLLLRKWPMGFIGRSS